jgi:hypothetical protein
MPHLDPFCGRPPSERDSPWKPLVTTKHGHFTVTLQSAPDFTIMSGA